MKILVLSPHTDDAELGCAGFIKKLIKAGNDVTVIIFSNCERSLRECNMPLDTLVKENAKSLDLLGVHNVIYLRLENRTMFEKRAYILNYLYDYNKNNQVDMLLIPFVKDMHQDHQTVAEEALRAFRRSGATILMYEVVATEGFEPNYYVPLTDEELEIKIQSLEQYESQKLLRSYFEPRRVITSMAVSRGLYIMEKYAEGYMLVRGRFDIK